MNLATVMDELGAAVDGIDGLRVFPYWADRITPPSAVVGWPDTYEYDAAYGRGADRLTVPVSVMVGRVDARSSRDRLARYADGAGAHSIKAAVEAHTSSAWDSVRVTDIAEFAVYTVASVEYLGATFNVEVIGKGS